MMPNPLLIPVGLAIGVLVAAPVGPVNVLCIQRAIERGFWGGVAAGLGAVLGDGLIALFAALGVGAISGAVQDHRATIQVIGGLALLAFGIKLYFAKPQIEPPHAHAQKNVTLWTYIWDVPNTFFLTITNPGAVFGLFAIFGGVSTFVEVQGSVDAFIMVASIMAGSLAWWVGLSKLISAVRHRIHANLLVYINKIAGAILLFFGGLLIGEIAKKYLGDGLAVLGML